MPLQRPPSPPSHDSSPFSSSSQPSLSTSSTSTSESPLRLSIPFGQLAIDDPASPQAQCVVYQQQYHFPRGPAAGTEDEGQAWDETMFNKRLAESAMGDAPQNTHPPSYRHPQRPDLPHRTSSFSKRHASFDSPREVPLPFMPSHPHHIPYNASNNQPSHALSRTNSVGPDDSNTRVCGLPFDGKADGVYTGLECTAGDEGSSSSDSLPSVSSSSSLGPPLSPTGSPKNDRTSPYYMDASDPSTSGSQLAPPGAFQPLQQRTAGKNPSNPVPIWSRPFSSPDASRPGPPRIHSPTPVRPLQLPDRSSTASLPLPSDTPYYTLPPFTGSVIQEGQETTADFPSPPGSSRLPLPPQFPSSSAMPSRSVRSSSAHSDWLRENFMSVTPDVPPIDRPFSSASGSSAGGSQARTLPPPAPPVVLTPPPPPLSDERIMTAPHEPFLAHAPAPHDSYIAVETNPREYRLLVRLPGFRRDAITLSTRKRRILHVVADSWEPGGGHFERRISFGYDADLAQVRAEFDGEFLRVIVPRRMVPVTF